MTNIELYLRLVFGTALVLAPGWALARALGVRSVSATLAWSLTLVFAALGVTFAVGSSLTLAIALLVVAGVAAGAVWYLRRRRTAERIPWRWAAAGAGACPRNRPLVRSQDPFRETVSSISREHGSSSSSTSSR